MRPVDRRIERHADRHCQRIAGIGRVQNAIVPQVRRGIIGAGLATIFLQDRLSDGGDFGGAQAAALARELTDLDIRDEPVEVVPLGMQKRVELARALAAEPELLILDEPMAGMNQEEKEYIARFILDAREERNTTIFLIEHHMDVVTALCDHVVVLSYGEKIAEGEPEQTISNPKVVSAYLGQRAAARRAEAVT